jgi:hypothetical protein
VDHPHPARADLAQRQWRCFAVISEFAYADGLSQHKTIAWRRYRPSIPIGAVACPNLHRPTIEGHERVIEIGKSGKRSNAYCGANCQELQVNQKGYRKPPEEIDMIQAERSIRMAGLVSLLALAGAVPAGYFLMPMIFAFPEGLAERLAFAAQASIFVLLCVVVAIGMVSTAHRFSPEDIGGSAARPPSEHVAIYVAFLQNTLEQAVIAVGLYFALATLLSGPWLALIPVGVLFFLIGRVLFFRGYSKGVEGRALGMTLTMTPTVIGYLLVLLLVVVKWI